MTQHTPTPWIIDTMTGRENNANAAFIVRACNSHDALVDALEGFQEWIINHVPDNIAGRDYHLNSVKAALALAKGE